MNEQEEYKRLAAALYDVDERKIARVYAQALLGLANERDVTPETLDAVEQLALTVFQQHPELGDFFRDTTVSRARKAEVIRTTLGGAGELLTNFFLVLNDHDRLGLLRAVALEFRLLVDRQLNRVPVAVRSAVPLTEDQVGRVKQILRDDLGKEPVVITLVDPDLLGGLVVRVGDFVYDGSVQTRLRILQNQLIEGGGHEIQVGRDRFYSGAADPGPGRHPDGHA